MLKHLMKFENWSYEIIPREIQLDIIDIMNDLKDDIVESHINGGHLMLNMILNIK